MFCRMRLCTWTGGRLHPRLRLKCQWRALPVLSCKERSSEQRGKMGNRRVGPVVTSWVQECDQHNRHCNPRTSWLWLVGEILLCVPQRWWTTFPAVRRTGRRLYSLVWRFHEWRHHTKITLNSTAVCESVFFSRFFLINCHLGLFLRTFAAFYYCLFFWSLSLFVYFLSLCTFHLIVCRLLFSFCVTSFSDSLSKLVFASHKLTNLLNHWWLSWLSWLYEFFKSENSPIVPPTGQV